MTDQLKTTTHVYISVCPSVYREQDLVHTHIEMCQKSLPGTMAKKTYGQTTAGREGGGKSLTKSEIQIIFRPRRTLLRDKIMVPQPKRGGVGLRILDSGDYLHTSDDTTTGQDHGTSTKARSC